MARPPLDSQISAPGRLSRRRADLLSSVLLLGFFATSMTQSSIPALSNILHDKEGLSAAQVGLLMSFYFLSYGALQVPAGAIAARWGGWVALAGFAALALGDLVLLGTRRFELFALARVMQGAGAAVMLPTAATLSSHNIPLERLGRGWSITVVGSGLGNLFALVALSRVASARSVPAAFAVVLILTLLAALVSVSLPEMRFYPRPRPPIPSPRSIYQDLRTVFRLSGIRWLVVFNVATISFGVGIVTWTPSYLHQVSGVSVTVAAAVTAGYAVGQLLGAPVAGFLITRFGNIPVMVGALVGMIGCGLAMQFVRGAGPTLVVTALVGFIMVASFSPSYAIIPYFVELKHVGLASGILAGLGFLGALVTPWLLGVMLDAGWGYPAAYGVLTAFALVGLVSALFIRGAHRIRVSV